jgi:hypothetical protein
VLFFWFGFFASFRTVWGVLLAHVVVFCLVAQYCVVV